MWSTLGWYIFPVHSIDDDGMCTCKNPDCKAAGKHPYAPFAPSGHNSASNDPQQIETWWSAFPWMNIGVDCGRSGLIVFDCDGDDGESIFRNWYAGFGGDLPETLTVRTGGGGVQFFFAANGHIIKSVNRYLDNNDIKAQGGYVVLPDSHHRSGRQYEIINNIQPVAIPELLAQRISSAKSHASYESSRPFGAPSYDFGTARKFGPALGYRDDFFNALAFALKKEGLEPADAVTEVDRLWALTEQPPGDEFPIEDAYRKLRRVYEDEKIAPDEIVEWNPQVVSTLERLGEDYPGQGPVVITNDQPPMTDVGNAQRLRSALGGDWAYVSGEWYMWDGAIWVRDQSNSVQEIAKGLGAKMRRQALTLMEEEKKNLLAWANNSENANRIGAAIKMVTSDPLISRALDMYDHNPYLLTVGNCTVELPSGTWHEFRREDLCTKRSLVPYEPGFRDPNWDAYLQGTFSMMQDTIDYVQRVVGSILLGEVSEKTLYVGIGPKNSGKTTFVNILETIMGDYAMKVMAEDLMQKKMNNSSLQYTLASMRGKRFISSDEPQGGDQWAEGLIKVITGGDTVTGRQIYKESEEFKITASLFVSANHMPRTNDDALASRIKPIPFARELKPNEQNKALGAMIKDPNSAFIRAAFAWAVEGCRKWAENSGIGTCVAVELASEEYIRQQDIYGMFISECLEIGNPNDYVVLFDVFKFWQSWAADRGERSGTNRSFANVFKDKNFTVVYDTNTGNRLYGVKIKASAQRWSGLGI